MNNDEWLETHRSAVNTWECDENNHLNVQFYWKRFAEALVIFGMENGQNLRLADRHARYLAELRTSVSTVVRSIFLNHGVVVHHLIDATNDRLSATAVDTLVSGVPEQSNTEYIAMPKNTGPRSLQSDSLEHVEAIKRAVPGRGIVSNRSILLPAECDHRGEILDQTLIGRFSDAAAHLWEEAGYPTNTLTERGLGRVAVEMKATIHSRPKAGTALHVTTWLESAAGKTITFRHQLDDMAANDPVASAAVTALIMDLSTRKAVELKGFFEPTR